MGGSFGLGAAAKQKLDILFTYDFNNLNSLIFISENLNDNTGQRKTHSFLLELNYGITKRLSATTVIPYVNQRRINTYEGDHTDLTSEKGLGDAVIMLKYRILGAKSFSNLDLILGGGLKLPTGRSDGVNNIGLLLPADMQTGSGSTDGITWLFFQKKDLFFKNLSLVNINTYKINGENPKFTANQAYRFGNEFQANLGLNYNAFIIRPTDIFAFIRYRNVNVDLTNDYTLPNSGGTWVYLIPGFNLNINESISLRFSGDIPLKRKLNGIQLTTGYKLSTSFKYTINTKSEHKSPKI